MAPMRKRARNDDDDEVVAVASASSSLRLSNVSNARSNRLNDLCSSCLESLNGSKYGLPMRTT